MFYHVDAVRHTVEQVFLYELYVKCVVLLEKCQNVPVNFLGSQFKVQHAFINLLIKSFYWATC